jgi:phage tail-like protein
MTRSGNASRQTPLPVFRFHVRFHQRGGAAGPVPLCQGAFSECTGLEATMEAKQIKEGGSNYGAVSRVGPVSFATVVLKRGVTSGSDLWKWFQLVAGGGYGFRLDVEVEMQNAAGDPVLTWALHGALPVKFKAADLNGRGNEVGIEELHLAHEGLSLVEM